MRFRRTGVEWCGQSRLLHKLTGATYSSATDGPTTIHTAARQADIR